MSYFSNVNESNQVIQVIRVDPSLNDQQAQEWVNANYSGNWIQTSYTGSIRLNFGGEGSLYDPVNDYFYAPQPYPSWILDSAAQWQPPVPYPSDGQLYWWDEATLSWVLA